MRIDLNEDEPVEIQMAPLIDCVFLLLTFFLVASTLKESVRELKLELPAAAAASEVPAPVERPPLIIAIDRAGQVYLAGEPMSDQVLLESIARRRADHPEQRIRLDADRDTPYHHIIRVLSALQQQGITDIGLQTELPERP